MQLDVLVGRLFDRIALNPIKWALGTIAAAILLGGSLFSFVEDGYSLVDGWWWAFVSLTTVGYGDIAPQTTFNRMLATWIIVSGVLSTVIIGSALTGRVTQHRLEQASLTPDLDDDIDQLIELLERLKARIRQDENAESEIALAARSFIHVYQQNHAPGARDCKTAISHLEALLDNHHGGTR